MFLSFPVFVEMLLRTLKDYKFTLLKLALSLQNDDKRTMETLYLK